MAREVKSMELEERLLACTEDENTEPVDSQESGYSTFNLSQSQEEEEQLRFWGRLYPLKASLHCVDLIENAITFGKGTSSMVQLRKGKIPEDVFSACSRLHFEIVRKQVEKMGAFTTEIRIICRSLNGVFVNGRFLNRNNRRTLNTNDVISLPIRKKHGAHYEDSLVSVSSTIPQVVRKKYEISKRLGVGSFGEVMLVFQKDIGKAFAMKTIVKDGINFRRDDAFSDKLLNEINILKTVKHRNIINLVHVMDCKREHFLILEFMEGKDLSHRIREYGKIDEDICKLYFYQIASGVKYLHSRGIIHRDLKPANILLESTSMKTIVKLTDFGLSKILHSDTTMKTLCGTKMYVAPEVLIGGGLYEYTEMVDVWSMGVLLYVSLSGKEPFSSSTGSIEEQIKGGMYAMPPVDWDRISLSAKLLIDRMLTTNPDERVLISIILEDCWLKDAEMFNTLRELYEQSSSSEPDDLYLQHSDSTMSVENSCGNELDSEQYLVSLSSPSKSPLRKKLRVR